MGFSYGPLSSSSLDSYSVTVDNLHGLVYVSDSTHGIIAQAGNPTIQLSTASQVQSNLTFAISGFGFCAQTCSTTCNQISLFQNSIQVPNISISLSSCSFYNLQFSVNSTIGVSYPILSGNLSASVFVNQTCGCGVVGVSAANQIAIILPAGKLIFYF